MRAASCFPLLSIRNLTASFETSVIMAAPNSSENSTPELEHEELAVSVPLLPSSSPASSVTQSFVSEPPPFAQAARSDSGFEHIPSPFGRLVDRTNERTTAMASSENSASGSNGSLLGGSPAFPDRRYTEHSRGSMILYRVADETDCSALAATRGFVSRHSTFSSAVLSLASDPLSSSNELLVPSSNEPRMQTATGSDVSLRLPVPRSSNQSLNLSENKSFRSSIVSLSEDDSKYPSMYGLAGAGLGLEMSTSKAADTEHATSNAPLRLSEPKEKTSESGGAASYMHTMTLIPYLYDPTEDVDLKDGMDEMDLLHYSGTAQELRKQAKNRVSQMRISLSFVGYLEKSFKGFPRSLTCGRFSWRGLWNVAMLVVLLLA